MRRRITQDQAEPGDQGRQEQGAQKQVAIDAPVFGRADDIAFGVIGQVQGLGVEGGGMRRGGAGHYGP